MQFLSGFWQNVVEFIEVAHTHFLQLGAAGLHVGVDVVVGNVWQTDKQAVGHALMGEQPTEVVDDKSVVLSGIALIDVGIEILDVHYPLVHQGKEPLQMRTIHVETGFNADVPSLVDERGEFFDEGAAQARLTATEGHTAASGEEIEVVDGKFLSEFVGGHLAKDAVGTQALGIETIAAAKRTAMESHQGGDPLAINRQPVTGYSDDGGFEHQAVNGVEI